MPTSSPDLSSGGAGGWGDLVLVALYCLTVLVLLGAGPTRRFPTTRRARIRASAARLTFRLPLRLPLQAEQGDLGLEVVGRGERAVDAGEPQVRDLVELAQRLEDGQADLVGRHLGP